jgi:hypothetical protein
MQTIEQWIGIDVCKRWLDVHLRPTDKSFSQCGRRGTRVTLRDLAPLSQSGRGVGGEGIRGCLKSQEGSQADNLSLDNLRQNLESNDKSIRYRPDCRPVGIPRTLDPFG